MSFKIEENGQFRGAVTFVNALFNAACVGNTHVKSDAAIDATKLKHQHRAISQQESDTTAAAEDRIIHVVRGTTGTLKEFKAGVVVACVGDSTITVDLHKNGVSVLTAAISIDSGDAAYALVEGTIDSDSVVVGDVLEVVVTVTAGTGTLGKGVFAYLDLHEDAS